MWILYSRDWFLSGILHFFQKMNDWIKYQRAKVIFRHYQLLQSKEEKLDSFSRRDS